MDDLGVPRESWLAGIARRMSEWWRARQPEPPLQTLNLSPPCSECGVSAATVRLAEYPDGWRLAFWGVADIGGGGADPVTDEEVRAIREALTPPYDPAKIEAADLYDDFGYCRDCGAFYCSTHWHVSTTGLGTCPQGHHKSLDPHWHPE